MFWPEKGGCMIKNIIFDIGNVLASFRPREVLEEMGLDETEVNVILDATVRGPYWVELDRRCDGGSRGDRGDAQPRAAALSG